MKKNKSSNQGRLMRNKTSMMSILVTALLIFSSVVSAIATIENSEQEEMNINVIETELPVFMDETSTGRAPKNLNAISADLAPAAANFMPTSRGVDMYTQCVAYGPSGTGWYYFDTDTPGTLNFIAGDDANLYNGGTWTCDQRWLVAEHYTGAISEIDPDTGDITVIGGGGTGLNALSFNPATNLLYGASSNGVIGGLWIIDPDDGTQTYVGDFVNTAWIIGMAFDSEGTLYAWDISPDYLYTVDTSTGEATAIGSLGVNLNYAQDGHFDMENDILYLTAYTTSGGLYTADVTTGALTLVGALQGGAECCGSMIKYTCIPPEHDVGVKSIDLPEDGYALPEMPMEVTVKNFGNHSEITDVQFEILKCEAGPPLLNENFSTWPPAGWSFIGYEQSFTNYAGGTSPEAYYGYYSGHYVYYGEITSPPVNATGFEKVNIRFHLMGEFSTSYSPYLYLEYRENASSAWHDVSPWDNPISGNLEPQLVEIGCYGWGEDIGNAFQARLRFGSPYYYLLYNSGIYVDDFVIEGCAGCAEYAELVEDVEIASGEEVVVEFPPWAPSEWGNASAQNSYEEYPMSAYTLLPDNNGQNDKKQRLLTLYFPWMHDVGSFAIDGPESGPAQTFDMDASIKNVGQEQECCFKVHMEVAELDMENSDELLAESFNSYLWPPGWTNTHPSNWRLYYSSYAGGSPYEARFSWSPSQTATFRLKSPPIDTTGYGAMEIEFKHYINHYGGPYTLKVETSPDGVSWTTVWDKVNPTGSGQEDVLFTTGENVGSDTLYVAWTFDGNSYNINYWYIDNIVINGFGLSDPEYEDSICIEQIDPGEEQILEFDDWTPEFLAEETSGSKLYNIKLWTNLLEPEEDNNHANDQLQISATLEFFHDAAIQQIASPSDGKRDIWDIQYVFDVYAAAGVLGNTGAEFDGEYLYSCVWSSNTIHQFEMDGTFVKTFTASPASGLRDLAWDGELLYGGAAGGTIWGIDPETETVVDTITGGFQARAIAYNDDSDTFFVSNWGDPVWEIDRTGAIVDTFNLGTTTSTYGLAYDMMSDDGPFLWVFNQGGASVAMIYQWDLTAGAMTGVTHDVVPDIGYGSSGGMFFAYDYVAGKTTLGCLVQGGLATTPDMMIMYEIGETSWVPGADIYLQPGSQNIEIIVENLGTFPELDMACYAEISEYITNCTNGTLVYEDNVTNIDLDEPLGGTETLDFDSYNFAIEGLYGLAFNLVDDDDDYPKNNKARLGIGIDDTPPVTTHTLDPATPDGESGYYVSDITVTLNANDPNIGECGTAGSGVKEMKYTINGDPGTVPGGLGTFTIHDDGNGILVEYWAIDEVGNAEAKNSFTVDMDQNIPDIEEVQWESFQDPPLYGPWYVKFTCTATDETASMDRVEMFINDGYYETITGEGPTYEFTIQWSPAFESVIFWFYHYDDAGNVIEDDLSGDEPVSYANYQQSQSNPVTNPQTA